MKHRSLFVVAAVFFALFATVLLANAAPRLALAEGFTNWS